VTFWRARFARGFAKTSSRNRKAISGLRRQDAGANVGVADGPQGERQGWREYIQRLCPYEARRKAGFPFRHDGAFDRAGANPPSLQRHGGIRFAAPALPRFTRLCQNVIPGRSGATIRDPSASANTKPAARRAFLWWGGVFASSLMLPLACVRGTACGDPIVPGEFVAALLPPALPRCATRGQPRERVKP